MVGKGEKSRGRRVDREARGVLRSIPDARDTEVGRRIRVQRLARGLSENDFGRSIGITFQQVQKYEKGASRVGAGRLRRIAEVLGVPIAFFFAKQVGADALAPDKALQSTQIASAFNVPVNWFELTAPGNAFVQRAMVAILRIAKDGTDEKLGEALAAPTDVGMIARAISNTGAASAAVAELDPFATLIAKGAEVKQTLIQQAGGLLSASEVAKARGLTPQAIYKQRKSGKLLSVPYAGEEKYPAIQFDDEGQPLPGLSAVLNALDQAGPWGTLDFLLSPDAELDGLSPIEMLRQHPEKLNDLVRLARTQGEHGPG
jgi:transcriptional regulator with XRE-family HTH domain